jgi:hypothetical protein
MDVKEAFEILENEGLTGNIPVLPITTHPSFQDQSINKVTK